MLIVDRPTAAPPDAAAAPRSPRPEPAARDRRAVAGLFPATRWVTQAAAPSLDERVRRALPLAVPGLALLLCGCIGLIWQLML